MSIRRGKKYSLKMSFIHSFHLKVVKRKILTLILIFWKIYIFTLKLIPFFPEKKHSFYKRFSSHFFLHLQLSFKKKHIFFSFYEKYSKKHPKIKHWKSHAIILHGKIRIWFWWKFKMIGDAKSKRKPTIYILAGDMLSEREKNPIYKFLTKHGIHWIFLLIFLLFFSFLIQMFFFFFIFINLICSPKISFFFLFFEMKQIFSFTTSSMCDDRWLCVSPK